MGKKVGRGIRVAAMGAIVFGVYLRFIRPWQLRWGATDEEVARTMPGDDVVKHPSFNATRAVTIQARPEEIWPWLVQIGITRAGWYSYDWLDNLGIKSAQRIIPQLQHVAVGDLVPISPDGKQGMYVKDFKTNHCLLWWDKPGEMTWYWGLYPHDDSQTRLITRVRIHYRWLKPSILFSLLVEFTDMVMMRKCLLGIKLRAEQTYVPRQSAPESQDTVSLDRASQFSRAQKRDGITLDTAGLPDLTRAIGKMLPSVSVEQQDSSFLQNTVEQAKTTGAFGLLAIHR